MAQHNKIKNYIIIFNYNYSQFVENAILSCSSVRNREDFEVIFADDGSSDLSVDLANSVIAQNNLQNVRIQNTRHLNACRRRYPSHGQLDGIRSFLSRAANCDDGFVFFLDADDYFNFDIARFFDVNLKNNGPDIVFLAVHNLSLETNRLEKIKIKRHSNADVGMIWPTTVPTSGLAVRLSTLRQFSKLLLNPDPGLADVWFDVRLNILSLNPELVCKYFDEVVVRLLHGSNDSSNGGLVRQARRQIAALSFREGIDKLNPCKKNLRYVMTKILSKVL